MFVERKTYTFTDHADEETSVTVSVVDGADLTLVSVTDIEIGDLYYESTSKYSVIESILGNVISLADDRSFSVGAGTVLKRIPTVVEYNPLTGGNPGVFKHWQDVTLMFKDLSFSSALVGFTSELSQGLSSTTVTGRPQAGWGLFEWGIGPWGGG